MDDTNNFTREIQLKTKDAGREFHSKNYGKEIQRPNVVDNICQGLLLQARIDRIVHGRQENGQGFATMIVLGFRFRGLDERRRFKVATITVTFQDAQKRKNKDPTVVALWPNGDYTLGRTTNIGIKEMQRFETGVHANTGLAGLQTGAHAGWKWENTRRMRKADRTTLTGSIILDMTVRDSGDNNAVSLTLTENSTAATGLVPDLRAVVLLHRSTASDSFLGTIKVDAKAHFTFNMVNGIQKLLGLSPANDPVVFQPDIQYIRFPTLEAPLEEKLRRVVDDQNLNSTHISEYGGVVGTTVYNVTGKADETDDTDGTDGTDGTDM